MQPTFRIISFLFMLTLAEAFTGCEGFKTLTIYNKTGQAIKIQTRPVPSLPDTFQTVDEVTVLPDNSFVLVNSFSFLLFNERIKVSDIRFGYLKIMTSTDTIIARDRSKILQLAKNDKTKYHRKTDKSFAVSNQKNVEAIVIRQ